MSDSFSADDSDNESTVSVIEQSSSSSSSSSEANIPTPNAEELEETYIQRLFKYVFKAEKDTVSNLQLIGSIAHLINLFGQCKGKKIDHPLIKNIWTLLCVIAGGGVATFESTTDKYGYYTMLSERFELAQTNMGIHSFLNSRKWI